MTVSFTINPPRAKMVDASGMVTSDWYRWFSRIQGVAVTSGNVANGSFLTLSLNPDLPSGRVFTPAPGQLTAVDGGAGSTYTLGLANTAVTAAPYGSASQVGTFTVDAKGRLIAAANVTITPAAIGAASSSLTLTAGAGLTGGGDLSANRTFDIGAGTGVTVNANDVALDTANTRNVDHASVTFTAGAGLTGGGTLAANRTFDIGAGTGITVNANDIALTVPTAAGTYTPTLTNVANVAASTAFVCQYMRVGDVVTVSGRVEIDPTTITTLTQLGMSLPIASNFTLVEQCGGAGVTAGVAGQVIAVQGDATNDRAQFAYICSDTANRSVNFSFTYLIV